MTFAFDERYAMFDITPVENQFILEYMPGAKGDYVKVYLYGLLCCYHPRKEMDVASMSRELGMTEDVILAAYRYWELPRLDLLARCNLLDLPSRNVLLHNLGET